MEFNNHFDLEGKHSNLSASQHVWLRYDKEKMRDTWLNAKAREKGTELHALASSMIKNGIKASNHRKALNMFVNDAIGFKMHSEVVLAYSPYAFGTADAISFRDGELRIHDLKTGISKPSFEQLDIYAAYFMLEYGYEPDNITVVERLYQGSGFEESLPTSDDIRFVMDKIVELNDEITRTAKEYYSQDF